MILHPYFSFTNDPLGVVVTPTDTPAVGGGWIPPKRRTARINGKTYIGTEKDIEALVLSMLDAEEEVEPVKPKKAQKKAKPVEIEVEREDVGLPMAINRPLFKALVRESYVNADPWMTHMLREIMRRYEDEEDIEILLMGLH